MKINITDLKKLQILKVKRWSVDFSYDGQRYLLHQSNEYNEHDVINLYRKDVDQFGRYTLYHMQSKYGWFSGFLWLDMHQHGTTYRDANKKYFVKKLVQYNFTEGLFFEEYKKLKERQQSLTRQIKTLEKEIAEVDEKFWED